MPTDIERLLSSGSLKTKDSSPSAAFASRAYELLGSIENAGADALDKTPIPQAIGSNPLREYAKESNAARDAVGYTPSQSMQNVQQAIADRTKDAGVLDSIIGAASALYDNAGDAYNSIPELIAQSAPDMAMLAAGGTAGRIAGFLLGTTGQARQNAEERAINNGMDKHQVESANLGDETFDPENLALAGVSYAMNYADVKILEGAMHAKGVKQLLARNLESPVIESVQEFSQSLTDTYAQTVDTKKGFDFNDALNQAKVEGTMGLLAGHGFEQAGNAMGLVKGGGAKAKELASDKITEQATTNTGKDMSGLTPDIVQSKIDKNLDTLSKVDIDLAQAESQEDIDALTKIKNQIIARNAILAQQKEALTKEQSKSTTEDSSLKNEPVEAQETPYEPEANIAEKTNKSEEKVLSDVSSEDTHVSEVAEEKQNEKVVTKDEVSTKPNKPIEQYKPKDIANLDADRFEELFATSFEKSTEPNTKIGSDVKVSMESRKALQNTGVVIKGKKHPKQKDDGTFFGSPTTDSSIDGIRSNINSEINAFAYMAKKDINRAKIAMQKYFNRMYASTANRTEAKSEAVINARNEEMANFVLLYRTLFGTSPEAKTATAKEVLQLADLKTNKSISEFKKSKQENTNELQKTTKEVTKKKSLLGNPVASPLDAQVADSMRMNTGLAKPKSIFQTPYREETHGLVQDNVEYIFGENTFEKRKDDSNNLYSQTSSALEMFTEIEKSVKDLFHNKFKKAFANTEAFSNGGSVGLNSFSFLSDERIAEASFISATLKLSNTNKTEEGYNLVYSIASSIGTDVINMLNLKDSDKASVVKQNAIRMAIGFAAMNAMENSGVITIEFIDGKAVAKPTGLKIKLPYKLKTHTNTQSYVIPRIGSEPKQRDTQTVDKNEHFTVTKKQLDGIKKLESVNYRVNTDFVNFLDKMAIDEKDMLEIEGYSDDKSQAQTLDKLREFIGEAGDSIFQYDYKIGTNSRGYIIQNVANFQSDKAFARNLITFEDNKIRNQKVYKAAFVQAFGFKLSEVGMFDSLVQEVENATSRADMLSLAKKYNGMHTLLAIHDYKDVYLKSGKEFSNIYIEVDGKTNGYAFGIMQLKSYDRNKLAQVGLFTSETENVKLDDAYEEVVTFLRGTLGKALSGKVHVGMTVQEYYGLKINRSLIKKAFQEFIYGAGDKTVIANMVDRFTDGKEISPEQRDRLTGLAMYIDNAIRQLHPEFVEYTNFVKSVYDLKFAVFNHKFEAFKNEVSKNKNMTVGEYKALKKELMKYAPSLHAIGYSEENTWKSTDAIPLYKTEMTGVVGTQFRATINKTLNGKTVKVNMPVSFTDFMPSAQSSAAAPLITHHEDSVTALGSIAEANQDLMYMYDAAASGMAGDINAFSNLYNDNFIELGRSFDVIEALKLEAKEAMSYIQKNRVPLNDKQSKAMVGFNSQYKNLVKITQKNNSKLDELSSVRQMESVDMSSSNDDAELSKDVNEYGFTPKKKVKKLTNAQLDFLSKYGKPEGGVMTASKTNRFNKLLKQKRLYDKQIPTQTGTRTAQYEPDTDKAVQEIKTNMQIKADNVREKNQMESYSDEDFEEMNRQYREWNPDYVGSSSEEDFSNKIKEFDLVHDSDALTNVFDEVSLFGERASVSHLSYLRDLVSQISNKLGKVTALEKISLYTASSESYGAYDTVSGNIDIAIGETKTYLGMTAAEIMAHELVHKATLYAYEYDTRIRAEANKIMQMAKAKMDKLGGFNLLLNKNSRGELIFMYDRKAEILEAKKRYEYIFSDAKEFVAFAGTSEKLMNILSTLDYDGVASTEKTILGKVIYFIQMVLNSFLGKSNGSTLDVRTKTLLASMYETNQRYAPMAIANEMTRYEKLFDTIADKKLVNQLLKMSVMLAKIGGKGVVGIFKFADKVAQITTNKKIMEFKLIKDIVFDLTHGLDRYPAYKALSQYHQKLQSEYNDISNGAKTELKNIMNNASDVTRSAYGLAVVDTDVQSLTRYSTVQKIDLIGKNEYRKKEIEKLETSMRGGISSKDNMRFYNYAVMQARGLGYYMATNITKLENQMLNAQNIASGKYIGLENYGITEEQINHLATLYALEYTNEATRLEVYMHAVENQRAFDDIVKFHAMVAKENKERLFDKYGEGHLFIKGYSKEINSPLVDAVIRNLSQKDEMEKNGYKLVSLPKEGNKLVKPSYEQQDMGVFVRYNIAPRMTEGIMDLINKEAKGTKLDDLRYESTGGLVHKGSMSLVDDVMSKAYLQQTNKLFEVSKLPDISMTPVLSPDGKIVNYRWMMSKNNKQELLKQDKRVDIVLGELYAFSKRKQDAEKLNQETVKQIIKDYSEMSQSEAGDFVEVSSDNLQEIYKLIPKRTVDFIKAETGAKKLMVRKGLLDIIFGYQDASISNIGWIKNSKFAAKIRLIEKIWQDMAAHSREGITIKTPAVIKGNVISNTFTLLFHGMQQDEAITKQIKGVKLLDEYRAMKTEFVSLEIQEKLGKPINKARKETLKKGFEKSPIYKLIKSGQFQSIVDDMSLDKMDTNSLFEMYGDAMLNKLPKKIRNVVNQAYINKDTELFRILMKTVQYSDFVAKYALYDFLTNKKGMSHHDALNICEKMFVSYAAVQNRYIKWSGDMMFFPFPKYFFRIQKAAIDAAINNPKAVTLGLAGQYITKNISDITDQSMLTYNIGRRIDINPMDKLMDNTIPHSVEVMNPMEWLGL